MYIIIAIIAFGILIAVHELGHFIAAKACGVSVLEFSIGMGPAIFKKQGKDTLYSLRILPIGGYCAMEGEDEQSEDPHAFSAQSRLKKFIILFAGAFMNLLLGFVIIVIIFFQYSAFASNTVEAVAPGFPQDGEMCIMAGDEIYSVDGMRVFYSDDFLTAMTRAKDTKIDLVVIRDGEKVTISDYELIPREYTENGETRVRYGINFSVIKANFTEKLKYCFYMTYDFVRMVWYGLSDLVTGAVGLRDLSGPVGIVSTMNEIGTNAETVGIGLLNMAYLSAFIAVNLAVMNLLPIPALDGGRIFFLFITWIIEKITRKELNPKYEGYIHTAGMILLLGLMAVVLISDVVKLLHG